MLMLLINLVLFLLIVGIVCGFLLWVIRTAPFIPQQIKDMAVWIVTVIAGLCVIVMLIGLLQGHSWVTQPLWAPLR